MCRPDRLTTGSSLCGISGVSYNSSLSSMGGMMKSSFGNSTASFFRALTWFKCLLTVLPRLNLTKKVLVPKTLDIVPGNHLSPD